MDTVSAWCSRRSSSAEVSTLSTEAQWEYACRAGTTTCHWGDTLGADNANLGDEKAAVGETTAVKRYAPNAWGLFDLHGNVWEWCADDRQDYRSRAA